MGAGIRFDAHALLAQARERGDTGGRLATAEHLATVHIPRRQIGKRPAPLVFVFHPHHPGRPGRHGGMAAAAGLNRGLLIRTQHVVSEAQRSAIPDAGVQASAPAPPRSTASTPGLPGAKPRLKPRQAVQTAADTALADAGAARWLDVTIGETVEDSYRQDNRGRSGAQTRYRRTTRTHH